MSEPAGIKFGHFTLGKRLARGGMAEVFLARQRGPEGFDRKVAVKRILPHLAETADFVRMFLSEARLAARLSHPNIVHIYELGQVGGDYFIAMEYVDGIHAGQLISHAERERLPPELVARIGADAAAALAYAHRLEDADGTPLALVHRDVSPHNLMVSFDGVTKLVDFGIAKAAIKADETRPGVVKGKYAYMSPEQTVGRALDGRSDVFSLGVVLWELMAGKTIVDRGDVVEAMKVIRDGRWTPIEVAAPRTPPALAKAIGWALAHKRDARATAAQLQVALEEFLKTWPQLATAAQLADWIRPRFPRQTGALPALGDGRGGRRTEPPPTTMPAGTAMSAALPARPGTEPVAVTDGAPAALGTAVVAITMSAAELEAATPQPPPRPASRPPVGLASRPPSGQPARPPSRRTAPPPLPRSVRAPTHLDESSDVDDSPDAPTREHQASAMMRRLPPAPRARWWIPAAVIAALVVAIALAFVIGRKGGAPAAPIDAAVVTSADAGLDVVALPMPIDAGVARGDAGVDATAAPATATLDLITRPAGAKVRVAGGASVTTPATLALPPGTVTLGISRDGYAAIERTLELAPGEHRSLELVLDKKSGGGGGGSAPRPPADVGYLTVRTNPYSIVTLGKKRLGETPFAGVEVPAGTHVLTFTNPDRGTVKRTVLVRPGQTVKLSFQLP
ncbi:MAG: protein kinase [Myxococcales bacterium]|nr:protein kinase [Myxococcales bacterium]MBK7198424.1 protein kinase [Myxococcales bacterium]